MRFLVRLRISLLCLVLISYRILLSMRVCVFLMISMSIFIKTLPALFFNFLINLLIFYKMNKMPKIEINSIPSQLNTEKPSGVASQLANVAADPPHFDGVSIEMMRNNPLYERIDDIDKRGRAIEVLEKTAKTVHSNRAKIRKFNEIGQHMQKPRS